MNRTLIALAAFGLFAVGCDGPDPTTPMADGLSVTPQANGAGVTHLVSVGGADICAAIAGQPPGCDGNFSLTARQKADGSVSGRWEDVLGGRGTPAFPVHIAIDCLHVDGNEAWVSGLITTEGVFAGLPVITRVADNGKSANDPLDQISFSFINDGRSCTAAPNLPLFDLTEGQVTVR